MRRLKKYCVGKYSSTVFSSNKNIQEDKTPENLLINLLERKEKSIKN